MWLFKYFPNLELLDESKSDLFNEIPFVKRGVTAFPPLTMRDVITANCRGVARINPCPIPANKVSPCCQDISQSRVQGLFLGVRN